MKIRMIYDECTPTRERRPITRWDVENDIHIDEYESKEELLDALLDLSNGDIDEIKDEGIFDIDRQIEQCLGYMDDLGDGSPNILYISIDGEEPYNETFCYSCLCDLDLENCSEDEVKNAIIEDEGLDWLHNLDVGDIIDWLSDDLYERFKEDFDFDLETSNVDDIDIDDVVDWLKHCDDSGDTYQAFLNRFEDEEY